jgi:lysophospholipase L1-like esterase
MSPQLPFFQSVIKKASGLIILALIFIGGANASGQHEAVVVLFGDSITTGFNSNFQGVFTVNGATDMGGCPSTYLNNILRKEKARSDQEICPTKSLASPILDNNNKRRNAVVANWGFGGTNSLHGVNRISSNLSETKSELDAKNYFVLIMYGSNDQPKGISTSVTRFNTKQMISKAIGLGYEPIIGTLLPQSNRVDVKPYNTQIVNQANEDGVFVVDHYARFISQPGGWTTLIEQEVSTTTGATIRLHPNDQGYLIIAETWFNKRLEDVIPGFSVFSIAPIINLLLED